ncbi:MAG: hypothetical protein F4X65_07040 [Chloroflexi bacterium]|nr:hypothetical protein [Chloroflexota bacterium]
MTTPQAGATPAKKHPPFRLPDIPEKDPDDMTSSKHLARNGNMYRLAEHMGNPDNIIVSGERYICAEPGSPIRYPDLLVSFNADPELYEANNGYVVSLQGKPPDLVLEIASRATGHIDTGEKPDFYAGLGIAEYWRFDETGDFHGEKLGGDRLVDGAYQPIPLQTLADGSLRGFSQVLGLYMRWYRGKLDLIDPDTVRPIASLDSLKEELRQIVALAEEERQLRESAEARAREERQLREMAEARIRELEEQLGQNQSH